MTRTSLFGRRALPFVLACVTVVGVTVAALAGGSASRARVDDPNDTKGALDIRRIWFEPDAGPPRWTVVLYSAWPSDQLRDRGFLFVFLDTIGDPDDDYYAAIRSDGRRLTGSLWRTPRHGPDVRLAGLVVKRGSDPNIVVQIPLNQLEIGGFRAVYRWWAISTFSGRVCRTTCVDAVPDEGAFEQPIGTPTTTPTATPTTTPTATPTVTPSPSPSPSVAGPR